MSEYIKENPIKREDILILNDDNFCKKNVCIVTGVSSGIGRATSIAAAVNGLTIVGLDIDEEGGSKTVDLVRELGSDMVFIKCDLTKLEEIDKAMLEISKLGDVRYLANIAGIQHIDAIENFPVEKYEFMMQLMLRAPFYLSKLTISLFKKNHDGCGVIGNMSSVHGHICTINKPVYNITKFALRGLTQSIAAEGKGKIRSFTVSTGFVRTALAINQIQAQAQQRNITPEEVVRDVMMGRSQVKEMMTPIEVGNLFMFGFSRFAKYLDGGDLLFDGGMVLTY